MNKKVLEIQNKYQYEFIGRKDALNKFDELHALQQKGVGSSLYVFAIGGIGKTKLLYEYICRHKGKNEKQDYDDAQLSVIDFYSLENRTVFGLQQSIVDRIGKEYFPKFNEYNKEHVELLRGDQDTKKAGRRSVLEFEMTYTFIDEAGKVPKEIIARTILTFDTFELVFNRPVGHWFLSRFIPEATGSGYLTIYAGRPKTFEVPIESQPFELEPFKEDARIYFKEKFPHITLGEPELMAIEASEGMPLLLDLIAFYLDEELGPKEDLKVATQEELKERIARVFFREEIPINIIFREMAYLKHRYDKDIFNYRKKHYREISDYDSLKLELQKFPFVKYYAREESYALHDAFRDMFETNYSHWYGLANKLYKDILEWYENSIKEASGDLKDRLQAEKMAYVLNLGDLEERVLDEENDYQLAKSLLIEHAQQGTDELYRLLINDISPDIVRRFPLPEDQYEVFSILGNMAKKVHRLPEAQEYWAGAAKSAEVIGDPKRQVDALVEQHNNTWQSDPKRSFELLNQASILCGDDIEMQAHVQYEIGFTYYAIFDQKSAIENYLKALNLVLNAERTLEVRSRIGTIYNDLGYSYLLIGDYDKAEVYIAKARAERAATLNWLQDQLAKEKKEQRRTDQIRKLEEQITDAYWRLGLTFNSLGDLARYSDNFDLASIEYSEAVELFESTNNALWKSKALHQRGDAHRQIAVLASRNYRVHATKEYDRRAYDDITKSIQLVNEYGLYEVGATAYRRLGRLTHDRVWRIENTDEQIRLLDEAHNHLKTALDYAIRNNDIAEELECLREIAFLADDRAAILMKEFGHIDETEENKINGYIELFRQGIMHHEEEDFKIYTFDVFKDLFTLVEAAYSFSVREYDVALEKYIKAFVQLASSPGYGVGCYRKHRPHIWERILSLDPDQRKKWCERFLNAWQSTKMVIREGEVEITKSLAEVHPKMADWFTVELESLGG